ncbi:Ufm1-specific protease 2 [Lamellibrachia satsuma]|nr:Ufm1-specific protease 2 [Lamellibrachia satsuma]
MSRNVLISHLVSEKLKTVGQIASFSFGSLIGVYEDENVHLIGCSLCRDNDASNMCAEFDKTLTYLPVGLSLCGVFFTTPLTDTAAAVKKFVQKLPSDLQRVFPDEPLLVCVCRSGDDAPEVFSVDLLDGETERLSVPVVKENILSSYTVLHLRGALPLGFDFTTEKEKLVANMRNAVEASLEKLEAGRMAFYLPNHQLILSLHNALHSAQPTDASVTCRQFFDTTRHISDYADKKRRKHAVQEVVDVSLMTQVAGCHTVGSLAGCVPVINHEHRTFKYSKLQLPLDVVVYVCGSEPLQQLTSLLIEGVDRQLRSMMKCLASNMQGTSVHTPRPYHFHCLQHLVTVVYPDGIDDENLEAQRREIHEQFLLPLNRPLLRRSNHHVFPGDHGTGGYLTNPHAGLPASGMKGGSVHLVDGTYTYHHYMQDRVDDNGWGCAYRSLQTLISWFRHQGYTSKPVPTHQEIQQALVDVGDKDNKFVGSKQWIGSTEVSYVLDHLIGVTSKIQFVSCGADLGTQGRQLAVHFDTQGTPVMIGGGVLAHTILGVDFNDVTGDIKFLILDPHYTGAEDLKTIQDKGWCGWKGPDFWDQRAHYNMCLPQRPDMI